VFLNEPLACYRQTPGNATDYFSRTATDLHDMLRFGEVLARRVPGFSHSHWRKCIRRHAEWGMNKWQKAGDEAAFRANLDVWRQFASPREKFSHRLKLAKRLVTNRAASALGSPGKRLVDGLFAAKERGKKLERSVRKLVRRRQSSTGTNQDASQDSKQAA
jgi:hypothetical protein